VKTSYPLKDVPCCFQVPPSPHSLQGGPSDSLFPKESQLGRVFSEASSTRFLDLPYLMMDEFFFPPPPFRSPLRILRIPSPPSFPPTPRIGSLLRSWECDSLSWKHFSFPPPTLFPICVCILLLFGTRPPRGDPLSHSSSPSSRRV